MSKTMLHTRVRGALLTLALVLGMVTVPTFFGGGHSAQAAYDPNDPTQRIDLLLTTLENAKDPSVPARWEYWSAEQISVVPGIDVSGTNVNIPNAVLTVKVKKSPFLEKPKFADSANATYSTAREDDDYWYIDYGYAVLKGGTLSQIPFATRFLNGITPTGTRIPVELTLYDGDQNVLKTTSVELIDKSVLQYKTIKRNWGAAEGYTNIVDGSTVHSNNSRTRINNFVINDADAAVNVGDLRHEGFVKTSYCIGLTYQRPADAPDSTGQYWGTTVTFTDDLPEGAELHDDALKAGWAYVPGSNNRKATLTKKAAELTDVSWQCGGGTRGVLITLKYGATPLKEGGVTKEYTNTASAVIDPGTLNYDAGSDFAKTAFTVEGFVRSGTLYLDKHSVSRTHTFVDGNIYDDVVENDLSDDERTGNIFGYNIRLQQENNGSTKNGAQSGGITQIIREIYDRDLDSRLYFRRVYIADYGRRNNTVLTQKDIEQRITDGRLHVYGVLPSGGEEKLSTLPLIKGNNRENGLYINDKARKYSGLVFRFDNPVVFDNMYLDIAVDVAPTADEVAKWNAHGYENENNLARYKNSAEVKYQNTRTSNIETMQEAYPDHNNYVQIQAITPKIRQDLDWNQTVFYQNCESKLIAKGEDPTKLTKENCDRVRMFQGQSYPVDQWGPYVGPLNNFKQIYLLPPGVNYVGTEASSADWNNNTGKNAEPTIVPNYNNSGKTAVIYDYGNISRNEKGQMWVVSRVLLDTSLYAEPGPNKIEMFTTWDSEQRIGAYDWNVQPDVYDINKNGDRTEKVLTSSVTTNFTPPQELVVRKNVSLDGKAWFLDAPAQDLGGDIYYRLEARNAGFRPVGKTSLLDIFPYLTDRRVAANEKGEYPDRHWIYVNENGEAVEMTHSSYETPLTEAVISAVAINNGVETDATNRFDFYYSTVQQGDTIETVRDGEWVTADQVTDWSKIRNFKPVLKDGEEIQPGEVIRFVTKHKIPYNDATKKLPVGYRAVNSVAGSLDNRNFSEANEVTSEIVHYTVDGIFFKDLDRNGIARVDEARIAGRTVTLIDATTGEAAVNPDGTPVFAVTDAKGYFKMRVFTRGNYRLQFEKQAEEVYTTVADGDVKVVNHVGLCGATATEGENRIAVATAENCLEDNAPTNAYGYSTEFTLDPTQRHHTRNAGVQANKRDVVIKKVDQDGNLLNGIGFTLTWVGPLDGAETPAQVPAPLTATTGKQPDENGMATFANIPFGKYELTETSIPVGISGLTAPMPLVVGPQPYATGSAGEALPYLEIQNNVIKATVTVKKVDADNTATSLAGAVFELVSKTDANVKYESAPSGADGVATFTDVLYGDYTLSEKTAPTNYVRSTQTLDVQVRTHAQTYTMGDFANTIFKGSVNLKKLDADTQNPIAGVVFTLHKVVDGVKQDAVFATQTTNTQGMLTFSNVPFGTYKLVEKTPATGYLPLGRELDVDITSDGQVVDFATTPITNTIKKSNVTLVKVDKEDTTQKLAGVTFNLYPKHGDAVATDPVATAETNAAGVATFENVRFGTYVVREAATLTGYVLDTTDREVNVTEDGQVIELGDITNQYINGSVTVKKVDDDTPAKPLAGVVFGLYVKNADGVSAAPAFEATTGADGVATFAKVPYGTYELREKTTIAGHNLNTTDKREIVIDESEETNDLTATPFVNTRIRGDIVVSKQDTKGNPLDNVVFSLFKKSSGGTVATTASYTATTGEDGTATFTRVLYGTYILKETTPKEGFNPSDEIDGREVSVEIEKQLVDSGVAFENKVITGIVKVTKVDKDTPTVLLGGVEFGLFKKSADGSYPAAPAYTATTQADGVATFADVEYGEYQLREITPLINYVGTTVTQQVVIRTEGQETTLDTVKNVLKKGTVTLRKVDADDPTKPVPGTQFALKQGDEIKYQATADAQGMVVFTDVIYGDYAASEVGVPENYNLNTTWTANVSIREDKQMVDLGTVRNVLKKSNVKVTKFSVDDQKGLAGAHFALKQGDQTIHEGITNDEGVLVFEKVVYGDYKLVETQAPEGFVLDAQPIDVSVREEGAEINAGTVNNRAIRGEITLTKVEAKNQQPLSGVEFELVDDSDAVVETKTTDDAGSLTFSNVRFGTYTVREKAPLEGYVAHGQTYPVTIETDKQVVELGKIENRKIVSDIIVKKVDTDTQKPLAGVVFGLFPASDDFDQAVAGEAVKLTEYPEDFTLAAEPTYQAESDADGMVKFTGVEYGKWILLELQPSVGYNPSPETFGRLLTVVNDGEEINVAEAFENKLIRGDVKLLKVNPAGQSLEGAKFSLTDESGKVVAEATSNTAGEVVFESVDFGKYQVKETAAPKGYIKSDKVLEAEVKAEAEVVDLGKVVNKPVPKKPLANTGVQTGVVYAALLSFFLGAGLLVARKRRH